MRDPAVSSQFPFGRLALAAGALVLLAGFQLRHARPASGHYRLELRVTDEEPDCFYGSAWYTGAPEASRADATITLQTEYDFQDGCTWEAIETLEPTGNGEFKYLYREHVVKCEPDAVPAYACVREGVVTAVPQE